MPEGPEIRLAADRLHAVLADRVVENAEFTLPALSQAARRIRGRQVERVTCHGKAMLTQFDNGETLYSHNQLYGVWRISKRGSFPNTNRQLRVALHTADHSAYLFSATDIELWPTEHLDEHPFLRKLGPDVLDERLTPALVAARLKDPVFARRSLASLYLDQGFIAGIGNYLRSEILFRAQVPPKARPADLKANDIERLARATLSISRRSYKTRGITVTRREQQQLARPGGGFESYRFAVFGREGSPCLGCGTRIQKTDVTARRLYWCPTCQPA
jgi:endonuclease-8